VALANMVPYRGAHPAYVPNRVWDLPPELQSEELEMMGGDSEVGVTRTRTADLSQGWSS
jgi:hypothetical protein